MKVLAFSMALLLSGVSPSALGNPDIDSRLVSMDADTSNMHVERIGSQVVAALGFITPRYEGTATEIALQFIRQLEWGSPTTGMELIPIRTHTINDRKVVRFQQRYRGVEIEGMTTTVQIDSANRVRSIHGLPSAVLPTHMSPMITSTDAKMAALKSIGDSKRVEVGQIELVILARGQIARLAHRVPLRKSVFADVLFVYIDAENGEVLWKRNPIAH